MQNGYSVKAIELAKHDSEILRLYTGLISLKVKFEDYSTTDKFSVILMSQVLEHSLNPLLWINKANLLLDRDGLLVIAVPNFNSIFNYLLKVKDPLIIPPFHLNYFTFKSLKLLLKMHGFEIVHSESVSRIPFEKYTKNIYLKHLFNFCGVKFLKFVDFLGGGMFINVVARKVD